MKKTNEHFLAIPTYSQKSGQWERNGSSSESDTFFRSLNQPEPDTDEEPTESPDDCMTDTEFDPELYIEEDDEDMDDAGDDKDEEDQFYDAVEHMGVVESVEPQDDVGNIYDADTEAEDDDQQQEDSSSEEDMEVDSDDSDNSDDSDDSDESDGDDPGLEALYKDPDEMTDAKWIASVRGAQRGANGMSFIEGSDHDIEAMTDAEFNASVRRAQRGRNGMSFTESPEHLDDESEDDDSGEEEGEEEDDEDEDRGGDEENESEDSEATISNPDMNFHSGEEGSDGERAGSSDQDGDENNPREPQPAKLQQSSTTDGGTEPSQVMEEGGPVISLGPPHASPDGVLPPTRER
ncbi:hypothetical protein QBC40DRAFT_275339 [Triangularia verruculosa]|uniref:Uncharacterized protein n=1 Tax=Triangularia verruculosa TaxID=2587418 RepID=A0AAN6XSN5_9PEZI|nr:hypothetical protein QBC40DRAFT_275339 [Triangularia verruculosa]